MTAHDRSLHSRGLLLMLASASCFTVNVLLIRALATVGAADVWLMTAVRFAAGLAVLGLVYRREVRLTRVFRRARLANRGIVGGLATCAFYATVIHLGAGRATFIGNTYVIFAALLAAVMLGEALRPSVLAGGVATLAGLALLTSVFGGGPAPGFYDAVAVATALASAYIVVTIRQLHATEHTATIFAAQCVYGLVISLVPMLLHPASATPGVWLVMIAAGVATAGGQLLMTRAFRDLPVAEGTLLQMLVPVGVTAGGLLFFQERFDLPQLTGAALILAGTSFTALRR